MFGKVIGVIGVIGVIQTNRFHFDAKLCAVNSVMNGLTDYTSNA